LLAIKDRLQHRGSGELGTHASAPDA